MNIPNLPTDNLYKFIALSGIIITLFCSIIPHIILNEIIDDIDTIQTERGELEFEIAKLEDRSDELEKDIDMVNSLLSKYEYDDSTNRVVNLDDLNENLSDPEYRDYLQFKFDNEYDIFPVLKLHEKTKELSLEIKELHHGVLLKSYQMNRKSELFKKRTKRINKINISWVLGQLVGIFMMILGFNLWYFRVQKLLDKKLKKEVEELNRQ